MDDLLPCPHCGSENLTRNQWSLNAGEEDAIECSNCGAGAPCRVWNHRGEIPWQEQLKNMPGEVQELIFEDDL